MLLYVLLAFIILVCFLLVIVILLQRSEGGALGMSGGGPGNFMTARGTGDLLTQTTQVLAGLFFVLCLAMTLISAHNRQGGSVSSRIKGLSPATLNTHQTAPNPAPSAPAGLPAPAGPAPLPAAPADPFASPASEKSAQPDLPAPAR